MGKPDWKTVIEQDRVLHPAGSSALRVLALNKSHLTGTGAFNYVFVFECKDGSVRKVFEATGEGVQLEQATANGIEISIGLWGSGDGHCCPSRVVQLRYSWSPRRIALPEGIECGSAVGPIDALRAMPRSISVPHE